MASSLQQAMGRIAQIRRDLQSKVNVISKLSSPQLITYRSDDAVSLGNALLDQAAENRSRARFLLEELHATRRTIEKVQPKSKPFHPVIEGEWSLSESQESVYAPP